jgi:hypothetical protein
MSDGCASSLMRGMAAYTGKKKVLTMDFQNASPHLNPALSVRAVPSDGGLAYLVGHAATKCPYERGSKLAEQWLTE